ncbi:ATP-binding cassette sub-family G member 1 isoform X2 [Bombus affinis]|uniref:ATP-binding cassette sub-family G member 1 isoform X2 n=1 Tax=Bombus affinis TaxID=309941 RepID=UPI0021B81639|nr:ATP-binding cassette sub-family G member 1 isoform X2 [Bombus affinis]
MTTSAHCSPSRSSLSCCQVEHNSRDDVHGVTVAAKDSYFVEDKYSFPRKPEVDLAFYDVRYRVKEWTIRQLRPKSKEILHGISGEFKAGELVAIMGPSGAGKSTLLNVLAGYTVKGVRGKILVNGKVRVPYSERWKRTSCYIQQESLMRTRITVGEAMTLAAHLKLGYSINSAHKHTQVLELLEMLGLSHCYDTLCGKLSGGQKKRLDVALELLSNPSVLFLDEPTTVLEVAIGDYGVTVDKLAAAVETVSKDDNKAVTYAMKSQLEESANEPPTPAGFIAQCYLLYKRQLLSLKRDYTLLVVRLLCHLLIGIIFGYLYMGSGYRANGVLANYVYLYGSLLLLVYTGKMAVTLAFPQEMRILSREHFNRWYGLAPYYISLLLVEIPFQAACAATYLTVSYWLTGQPIETPRIISFMVVSIAASLTAQAWGFFIGATTPVKIAVFAGPIIAVLFSVFGFCIRYMDTPQMFRWMFHISYFRASFHSLLHTVYGFDRMDLKCDDFYCHYKKPTQFLKEMEIVNISVANNLILIIGIGVLMHLLTASALWCKLNRR